jgi:ADP-L-glycero-D-manno-heptose-6-epimerase
METMRILVTGADGFIGREVAKTLAGMGHEIVAFVYEKSSRRSFDIPASVIKGDICRESDIAKAGRVDCIHHLAANADPTDFGTDMMLTNVVGTKNLLELARKCGAKFVFSSSAAVYGNLPAPNRDDGEISPANAYGFTKAVSELFCKAYAKDHGIDAVMLRYFNTYGVGEDVKGRDASMVFHFMQSVMKGDTIKIYGDGKQSRDFIYVKDVARANALALEKKGISGQCFNVGTGRTTNFNDLVRIISEKAGRKASVEHVTNPLKSAYQTRTMADMSNTKARLGFVPEYSLEDGIAEMAKYYNKYAPRPNQRH